MQQYEQIKGHPYTGSIVKPHLLGHVSALSFGHFKNSITGVEKLAARNPAALVKFHQDEVPNIESEPEVESRTVIVVGMHRSGTSMLTGTLREVGLSMGGVNTKAPHNVKGNMEHPVIMHMQEDLLKKNGGAWHDPPKDIEWSLLHKSIRDLFVARFEPERFCNS